MRLRSAITGARAKSEPPEFWRSAVSEDSEARDVDAGRLVVVAAGLTAAWTIVLMPIIALVIVSRGGPFDLTAFGTSVGIILAGVAALVGGGGVNTLLKSKGEGPPS